MTAATLALLVLSGCARFSGVHDAPPPGDPSAYEPLQNAAAVQAFVGADSKLVKVNAKKLKSDGTMDLGASYEPYTVYTFLRPSVGDATIPVGAGGGPGWESSTVRVGKAGFISITQMGGPGPNVKKNVRHRGMVEMGVREAKSKDVEDAVALPTCRAADLWAKAIKKGAPADAVATLHYDDRGYSLRIDDIDFRMDFDATCKGGKVRTH